MDENLMYANKIAMIYNGNEIVASFRWVIPNCDEQANVTGERVAKEQVIVISKTLAEQLHGMLNDIMEKQVSRDGAE